MENSINKRLFVSQRERKDGDVLYFMVDEEQEAHNPFLNINTKVNNQETNNSENIVY